MIIFNIITKNKMILLTLVVILIKSDRHFDFKKNFVSLGNQNEKNRKAD